MEKNFAASTIIAMGVIVLSTTPVNAASNVKTNYNVFESAIPVATSHATQIQDPWLEKPVLGYLIDTQDDKLIHDILDLQNKLGLTNEQLGQMKQIGHIESFAVNQIEKDKKHVSAATYNAKVKNLVNQSDREVKEVLGSKYGAFRSWVQNWFEGEVSTRDGQMMQPSVTQGDGGSAVSIWATQYDAYSTYEVALPDQNLKVAYSNGGGYSVNISRNSSQTTVYVKEVGPWNVNDNYWDYSRREFKTLAQYDSESREAYYYNYNGGYDDLGYKVTNPAGIDLSPAVATILGMGPNVSAFITVNFTTLP